MADIQELTRGWLQPQQPVQPAPRAWLTPSSTASSTTSTSRSIGTSDRPHEVRRQSSRRARSSMTGRRR
eukprot:2962888-Heterocapsa_arctica.AAC.1